jgi:hypothetical protein
VTSAAISSLSPKTRGRRPATLNVND